MRSHASSHALSPPVPASRARTLWAVMPWIGVPFLLYLVLLRYFWFNAPVWDDVDGILHSIIVLNDSTSAREWLGLLLNQHNEHRIAFARLAAWTMATVVGHVDFRVLVLIGNLAWLGILLLFWAELRDRLPATAFAAAAFITLQLSYYEASLLSMAAMSNIGAVFFALACIYFADRDGKSSAAVALFMGILAVGAQASGLFALPVAAAFCAMRGRRMRAAVLAAAVLIFWILYFRGYVRPGGHPSVFAALTHPLEAIHLFLIIAGGLYPGQWLPIPLAIAVFGLLAWSIMRGLWRVSPTTVAWIAFIIVCIAATTAGRAGFGPIHASRYAIYSTCLVVLTLLGVATVTQPWTSRRGMAVVAGCVVASILISLASLWWASIYSLRGNLLVKAVPASGEVQADKYFGLLYPDRVRSDGILIEAEKRGIWSARPQPIQPSTVRLAPATTLDMPRAGYLDQVVQEGKRLQVNGWSHIPATIPGRTLTLAGAGNPIQTRVKIVDRVDVATSTRIAPLVYSGFEIQLEYASENEAAQAARALCVLSETPSHEARLLQASPGCPPLPPG